MTNEQEQEFALQQGKTASDQLRKYTTCQVADAMHVLELMPCHIDGLFMISPGDPQKVDCKIVGPAHVAQFVPCSELPSDQILKQNFVDTCSQDCVAVISARSSLNTPILSCNWGGLMACRAKKIGVSGAIVDGRVRDIEELRSMEFPVFSKGSGVHGAKGFTVLKSIGQNVSLSGVVVMEGDIIMADINGVVRVTLSHWEQVLSKTEELTRQDGLCMADLESGSSLNEAFKKHRT